MPTFLEKAFILFRFSMATRQWMTTIGHVVDNCRPIGLQLSTIRLTIISRWNRNRGNRGRDSNTLTTSALIFMQDKDNF